MSKVKVSKEVGKALDLAIEAVGKGQLLNDHFNIASWKLKEYLPLNQISNWEMAQILVNGYEIEDTAEKQILALYTILSSTEFEEGLGEGIKYTLDKLGIKIKGIND